MTGGLAVLAVFAALTPVPVMTARFACHVPLGHAVCGAFGWMGVPAPAERAAWEALPAGNCSALRTFASTYPNGDLAAQARKRLLLADKRVEQAWGHETRHLALTVRRSESPFATEGRARADAIARAQAEASSACAPYGEVKGIALQSAVPIVQTWRCLALATGVTCGFDGQAECRIEVRAEKDREVCP